jgi:hypothetical protein
MAGEQDRSRTDPFAGQPPNTARDYSRAPSDLSSRPTRPPVDKALTTRRQAPEGRKEGSAKPLLRGGVTEGTRTPDLRDHNPTL